MATITCSSCRQTVDRDFDLSGPCPACGRPLTPISTSADFIIDGIDVRRVARHQRRLLWYILGVLGVQFLVIAPLAVRVTSAEPVVMLFQLALGILAMTCVSNLLAALNVGILLRVVVIVLAFVPCCAPLLLFALNGQATRILRKAGLHVGFMGVRDEDVVRQLSRHLCRTCGYNLTGNISGRCPECGTLILRDPSALLPAPAVGEQDKMER